VSGSGVASARVVACAWLRESAQTVGATLPGSLMRAKTVRLCASHGLCDASPDSAPIVYEVAQALEGVLRHGRGAEHSGRLRRGRPARPAHPRPDPRSPPPILAPKVPYRRGRGARANAPGSGRVECTMVNIGRTKCNGNE
jgi:hypothetical protein